MLEKGQQIGRYKILSAIGAGGMGEVFLAEDTRLRRKVALKILPENVASDKERLHRFEQEAYAASALNHPNILTIHEFGAAKGTHFIATEYVDGETLREKLKSEELSLTDAMSIAEQIAFALSAAHSAGIVHRDLKPENIMIRADWIVKILDFGLAKLIKPEQSLTDGAAVKSEIEQDVKTRELVKTNPGVVMGTVAYMSPEQARGKETDARTDIWSLGVLIYEMVSRRTPFASETTSDVIAAILTREPSQLSQIAENVPAELQRIVGKTLRKNRDERYQNVKDLWIDLKDLRQELEFAAKLGRSVAPNTRGAEEIKTEADTQILTADKSAGAATDAILRKDLAGSTTNPSSSAEYILSSLKRHKGGAILVLAFFLIALAGISYGIYKLTSKESKSAFISLQSAKFARLTNTGKVLGVSISPDGKYIAHVMEDAGQQSLWIRQTATSSNVQIVPPNEITYRGLTFSPDGNYLYYSVLGEDRTLYQVPSLGGTPKKLLADVDNSVTFSPDGKQIAFFRRSIIEGDREDALIIANADGTVERKLTRVGSSERFYRSETFSSPSWSPDGKWIAIPFGNFAEDWMTVAAVSVETGEVKILTAQRWYAVVQVAWLADGSGILLNAMEHSSGAPYQIWQVSPATGEAQRVTNDLISYRSFSLTGNSDALAAVQGEQEAHIWVMPAAGDSTRATQITSGKNSNTNLAWTPDGRIIYLSNANGSGDIFLTDSRGSSPKQLTADPGTHRSPSVTPDGRFVVFSSNRAGPRKIWRMDLDGGNQKQLTDGFFDSFLDVSPDGAWIVYSSYSGQPILRKIGIDGGQPVQLTDYISSRPAVSPDGKQIACLYQEEAGLSDKIAILSSEGGPPLKILPVVPDPSTNIHWSADGREIVYASAGKGVSNLWAQPIDGGKPRQITNFTQERIFWFDFSPDGKQLALSRGTVTGDVVLIKDFK